MRTTGDADLRDIDDDVGSDGVNAGGWGEFGALAGHAGIEGQQIETVLETVGERSAGGPNRSIPSA